VYDVTYYEDRADELRTSLSRRVTERNEITGERRGRTTVQVNGERELFERLRRRFLNSKRRGESESDLDGKYVQFL